MSNRRSLRSLPVKIGSLLVAVLLAVITALPARAEDGRILDETSLLWFVELSNPPAVEGTNLATLKQEKDAFRNNARRAGLRYTERYAFDGLFNGFSVRIDKGELSKLSRISGVKAIYPVLTASLPQPVTNSSVDPDLATAISMTGASIAQNELGLTGKGVRVAVMDSGIDIDHPDFGGTGQNGTTAFPTKRIIAGYDFVGDAFNADPSSPAYNPQPVPDANPDDCGGHGTHVAGIVGANGKVKGVAPSVVFGAYRVFGCEGSTTADIMIAAMERAQADGMQILNMSIGSAFMTWPQYPTAAAADRLVNKGIVVVTSIGNSGANGLYSAGAPGVGRKVIGVASADNTSSTQFAFSISPDNKLIGYGGATGAATAPQSGSGVLTRTGTQSSSADACSTLPEKSLAGQIALIRRGTCGFYNKALNAQNAGAAAVVLYNNQPGSVSPTVVGLVPITIPVVMISQADGNLIDTRLASGPVTLTWTNQTVMSPVPTAGLISSFSSYGLNAELDVKPDITAPGGNIWSTYPLEKGGYANIGGTSMASPHVAGSVALLLEAKPRTPAQAVRSILQNSADPLRWWGNPTSTLLDNVHRQGAGMLDIDDAILTTTKIEPGKLSLGESEAGPRTETLTIENNGKSSVTYNLSHAPALGTDDSTFVPKFNDSYASLVFSSDSITIPAGGKATVNVTITANSSLANRSQYGGYIVFTPQDGGSALRIPYAGLKGDYQSIQVLAPTANEFPWLARVVGPSYEKQNAGATFNLTKGDLPYFVAHFDHQSRRLRIEVIDAKTGQNWGRAVQEDFLPRNSTASTIFAYPFDGSTLRGKNVVVVPDGQYVLQVSVLKALGDENNPAHTETWTSPVFTIQR